MVIQAKSINPGKHLGFPEQEVACVLEREREIPIGIETIGVALPAISVVEVTVRPPAGASDLSPKAASPPLSPGDVEAARF